MGLPAGGHGLGGRARSALFVTSLALSGCVADDAGYRDVRKLTSERLSHDVRLYEHDTRAESERVAARLREKPLDADAAVALGLLQNPRVQAAFDALGVARGELVEASALPNPRAEGALRFRNSKRPEIDLTATLELSAFALLPARRSAAFAELDAAKLEAGASLLDLALEIRRAVYALAGRVASARSGRLRGARRWRLGRRSGGGARAAALLSRPGRCGGGERRRASRARAAGRGSRNDRRRSTLARGSASRRGR